MVFRVYTRWRLLESILLIPLKHDIWNSEKFRKILVEILSYPKNDEEIARERFNTLVKHGLEAFILEGPIKMGRVSFLGKGTNSLVIKAIFKKHIIAIKILRLDASRKNLLNEVKLLLRLKETGIVPRVIVFSDWFIIEEFIEGVLIGDFLQKDIYSYDKREINQLIADILSKSYTLDQLGIDHGELSRADRHIIITDSLKSIIIDFESASESRKPKNITTICHYLFVKSQAAEYLRLLYNINLEDLNNVLKSYKRNITPEKFRLLMNYLDLQ